MQEHIEPAKPAREHVTTIDGEIQTWLLDTNFSNIQIWKGSNARMHSCVLRVPWHGPRVNRGFNPTQQQPSHSSRQQRAQCTVLLDRKTLGTYLGEDCRRP